MLEDLLFLIRYREKPNRLRRWVVVWMKRFIHSAALLNLLLRPAILRLRGASLGRLLILGRATIQGPLCKLQIGEQTSLGRCRIFLHDKISIGRCVAINDGAILLTASHHLKDSRWGVRTAAITIGDYAWIATNAIILPGVSIGRGAVVGAGAVVRQDLPDYAVASGNPATILVRQRTQRLDYSPVFLNAPFEAWIGRKHEVLDADGELT